MEIIQHAEEAQHKLKYSEFDVTWHQSQEVSVPLLVLLTHPMLTDQFHTVISSLGLNAKRGCYPATYYNYAYAFDSIRMQDHPNAASHKAMRQRQKSCLIQW